MRWFKPSDRRWFKPFGILFMPASFAGWLLSFVACAFCLRVFWFIDTRSHSASDTLYGIFPYWVATFLVLAWIAGRTGGRT